MISFSIFTGFICLNFLTHLIFSDDDELVAFPGCDVTLEWNISSRRYERELVNVRIIHNTGDVIAAMENDQCINRDNSSMSCATSSKNDTWIILLTLLNITTNHTGNYTAWVQKNLHIVNMTTSLIVIDKPQILAKQSPVLYKPFSAQCITSPTSDCITYHWKLNNLVLPHPLNVDANKMTITFKNITLMDNLTKLTCQAGVEECSNILCNSTSEDSEPYTVVPFYGPASVYLIPNKSDIYLEQKAALTVKCSAFCYPGCKFRWESYYINVDNEELVINSFSERLVGVYTCTAINGKTGVIAKSFPLFLHSAKVSHNSSDAEKANSPLYLFGVGLVIVAISLAIVFVYRRRKFHPRGLATVSMVVQQPCVEPSNREITPDLLRLDKQDRPRLKQNVPKTVNMIPRRSAYHNVHRKSVSLLSFYNHNQTLWKPLRQSSSSQTLIQSSHGIGRRSNSVDSICIPLCYQKDRWYSSDLSEHEIRMGELYSKVTKQKKEDYSEQKFTALPPGLPNLRRQLFEQEQEEQLYDSIDETNLPMYDYPGGNLQDENLQHPHKGTEFGNHDYDYAFLPPL